MERLGGWVVRHRLAVGLAWLVVTVVGVAIAPSVSGRLVSGVHLHSTAFDANQRIAHEFGGATADPGVLIVDLPQGQTVGSPEAASKLDALDRRLAATAPTLRTSPTPRPAVRRSSVPEDAARSF